MKGPLAGTRYLVTELLTGQTLRTILSRGPLPVRQALDVARVLPAASRRPTPSTSSIAI